MFWGAAITAFLALLLFPSQAYAWGLATHVEVARILMSDYRDVLQAFASCILAQPDAFMYGSISPDHFLMKNLKRYRDHSHNWDNAFEMLKNSNSPRLEAFSLGYLAHLAADAVAHNIFVPGQIATSEGIAARRHTIWELRFDCYQPHEAATKVLELEQLPQRRELDRFLASFHTPSVFDLPTNLQLTSGAHRVLHSSSTRSWVGRLESRAVSRVSQDDVRFYNRMSLLYVLDVIRHGPNSLVVGLDPRGGEQIASARYVAKESKRDAVIREMAASRFVGGGPKPALPSRKSLHSDVLSTYLSQNVHLQEKFGFSRLDGAGPPSPSGLPGGRGRLRK